MYTNTLHTLSQKRRVIWKTPSITVDGLKNFACLTMLLQTIGITVIEKGIIHLGQYTQAGLSKAMAEDSHLMFLAGAGSLLQLAGGLAVPIFAFLLVEGFFHTSDYRRYLLTMITTAVLSEIPYDLAMSQKLADGTSQNALVSMCVSLLMLYFLRMFRCKKGFPWHTVRLLIVVSSVIWVTLFRAQYGLCMVLLTAIFYLYDTKNVRKTVLGIAVSLLYVTGPISFYGIWCYNGVRTDRVPKYAYYAFYPVHLFVLGISAIFMQG